MTHPDPNQLILSLMTIVQDQSPGSGPMQEACDAAQQYLDTQAKMLAGDFATLTYKLDASTGYLCEGTVAPVTPRHWGRITAAFQNQVSFLDREAIREDVMRTLKARWLGDDHEKLGAGVAGTAAMKFARSIQTDQDLRVFVDQWCHAPANTLRALFPKCPEEALNFAYCPSSANGNHSESWWDGQGCTQCGAPSLMRLEMARLGMVKITPIELAAVMVEASPGVDMGTAERMADAALKWLLSRPEEKPHAK